MSSKIGKYFGREIGTLEPIMASWNEEISLTRNIGDCTFKSPPIYDKGYVWPQEYRNEKLEIGGYRVIGMLPTELCHQLAPNVESYCLSAAVVDSYYPAARAPYSNDYYAYGLFLNENGEQHTIPLRKFSSLNRARLYTEGLKDLSSNTSCLIDGKPIELKGTVKLETFAGPPNYESIENGDKELRYWILTTSKPINCAYRYSIEKEILLPKKGSYSRFQLVDGNSLLLKEAQKDNQIVTAYGELMSSHTGYHQTSFLLYVANEIVDE
jgi:hypothetical protein